MIDEGFDRLSEEVSRILWEEWDPIMVTDTDCPRDEYDSYVMPLISIMLKGGDSTEISSYLESIETDRMGLPAVAGSRNDVATACLAAYQRHGTGREGH